MAHPTETADLAAGSRGANETAALRTVSVLVVDDDRDTREMIAELLDRAGYSVETACNGQEALACLRSVRPAMILLDVCMPIMDGAEFREVQRRDRSLLEIPTIVMTAAGKTVEPQLDLAVELTLRKPIRTRDLLAIVARHCQPSRA